MPPGKFNLYRSLQHFLQPGIAELLYSGRQCSCPTQPIRAVWPPRSFNHFRSLRRLSQPVIVNPPPSICPAGALSCSEQRGRSRVHTQADCDASRCAAPDISACVSRSCTRGLSCRGRPGGSTVWWRREGGGNSGAAAPGQVRHRRVRRRGQGLQAREAEKGSATRRSFASRSGRMPTGPRTAWVRSRRRAGRPGS